jgi:hypothetical protein
MAIPCKKEQRRQATLQACNRVRSGLIQRMIVNEGNKLSVHAA